MTMFETMLEFLKQQDNDPLRVSPKILEVLGIQLKDYDDKYGAIGEHYFVRCKMRVQNIGFSEENTVIKGKTYEADCLVDREEFDKFKSKRNTVIWL